MTPYDQLSEEAKRKRLEYLRQWRKRNPDKVRMYTANYWNRKAEQDTTIQTDKEREVNNGNDE